MRLHSDIYDSDIRTLCHYQNEEEMCCYQKPLWFHNGVDPNYLERKEGKKIIFNDALNTFYIRLYDVRHMVKDHSERNSAAATIWATLSDYQKGFQRQDSTYHGLCYISHEASIICTIYNCFIIIFMLLKKITQKCHRLICIFYFMYFYVR